MMAALDERARRATSCCSTAAATIRPAPTSTHDQWAEVTRVVAERGLLPFVDIAYQGFGRGLDEDAAGLRGMLAACDEVLVAQSCDKNFGVYRDRVGSLFLKTGAADDDRDGRWRMCFQLAREMWSMPPDHGAAAVRIVLDDAELRADWRVELDAMRDRINAVRAADRRRRPAPRLHRRAVRHVLDAAADARSRCSSCARTMRSTWPTAAASTSSAWPTTQIDRFIAAVVEALDG